MSLTSKTHNTRRASFHWLALTICATGILMSAFFNLGAASADPSSDMAALFLADEAQRF